MWWWQSQAPTGAFSLACSLPDELGACWAWPGSTASPEAAAAKAEAPLMNVRRAIMWSSGLLETRLFDLFEEKGLATRCVAARWLPHRMAGCAAASASSGLPETIEGFRI